MCKEIAATFFRREKGKVFVTFENYITGEKYTKSYRTDNKASVLREEKHNNDRLGHKQTATFC